MSRWSGKYVIGLTGNIATGKSLVRKMLEHLGAFGIDADGLSAMAMTPGAPAYQPVVDTFGNWIVGEDKRINREALARVVFSDPTALAKLEAVVHPVVSQAIDTLVGRAKQKVVVIEAIKLLESELADSYDTVWVVDAPESLQLSRLMDKRGMSELDARQRMLAQSAQSEKLAKADVVIKNDGSFDAPWMQVQTEWAKIAGTPAPASVQPKAVAVSKPADIKPGDISLDQLVIERGGPDDAEAIAQFINAERKDGSGLTRIDIMMSFGQKAYLTAASEGVMVGLVGFQVENLITAIDELYLRKGVSAARIVALLIEHVEQASADLQSEISMVFVPDDGGSAELVQAITDAGYEPRKPDELQVLVWRDSAAQLQPDNTQLLTKRLRDDRVLKPI